MLFLSLLQSGTAQGLVKSTCHSQEVSTSQSATTLSLSLQVQLQPLFPVPGRLC